MSLLESIWFLVALLIIGIVLLIDPKSSTTGSGGASLLGGLATPSSEQKFIYRVSAFLIATFFISTVLLSFVD